MYKRTPNFNANEEELLLSLVKKYRNIIENKRTDHVTTKQKLDCWMQIEKEYNTYPSVVIRTVSMLKNKYENIKKNLKKKFAEEKRYLLGTGGGPALPRNKINDQEQEMIEILGAQITGLPNEFDDDALGDTNNIVADEIIIDNSSAPNYSFEIIEEECDRKQALTGNTQTIRNKIINSIENVKPTQSHGNSFYVGQFGEKRSFLLRPSSVEEVIKNSGIDSTRDKQCAAKAEETHHLLREDWPVAGPSKVAENKRKIEDTLVGDWDSYNPSKLKEPRSTPLRRRTQKNHFKDKITQWANEKVLISQGKKEQSEIEFNMLMEQRKEKHNLELKLMAERGEREREKHLLEMEIMREEHAFRIKLMNNNLTK